MTSCTSSPLHDKQACGVSTLKGSRGQEASLDRAGRGAAHIFWPRFCSPMVPLALLSSTTGPNKRPVLNLSVFKCWTANISHETAPSQSCWAYIIDLTTCVFVCCCGTQVVFISSSRARACVCVCACLFIWMCKIWKLPKGRVSALEASKYSGWSLGMSHTAETGSWWCVEDGESVWVVASGPSGSSEVVGS